MSPFISASSIRAAAVPMSARGVRTVVATLSADDVDTTLPYTGLGNAERFAVDFNPVADRLRVISDRGLNLRINADTGAATLFRNTTGDATRSLIGGSAGPSVLDMAIRL